MSNVQNYTLVVLSQKLYARPRLYAEICLDVGGFSDCTLQKQLFHLYLVYP